MAWDVDGNLEEIQLIDEDVWEEGHTRLTIFGRIDDYDGCEEIQDVIKEIKLLRHGCEIVYES